MQRLLTFLLATPLAVTLAVDVSYQDADTNSDGKISGTECAALDNGDNIVVDSFVQGSVDIGSGSGDDCSRITVRIGDDLVEPLVHNYIAIGSPMYPVCLSSDVTIGGTLDSVKIYDQDCNTDFEIKPLSALKTRELILKSTCAPSVTFDADAVSGVPPLKFDYPDTCVKPGIDLRDSTHAKITWSTEVSLSDVPEDIKDQIKAGITREEVPQRIKTQILAGITKDEVPASVVAAIEAEAVAAMTPEELKDAYETISKQCESWGIS